MIDVARPFPSVADPHWLLCGSRFQIRIQIQGIKRQIKILFIQNLTSMPEIYNIPVLALPIISKVFLNQSEPKP